MLQTFRYLKSFRNSCIRNMTTKTGTNSFAEIDKQSGEFKRTASRFRDFIAKGAKYEPAAGRYHLYVSYACPWASRCLMTLSLKGIDRSVIPVHSVAPTWGVVIPETNTSSWVFGAKGETFGGIPVDDPLYGSQSMRDLYERAVPGYDGKYTVPVLWDSKTESIVNNESSEIIRMFNKEFDEFAKHPEIDLAPEAHLKEMDELHDSFYNSLNNGVYRCGFATTQEAYDAAYKPLFETLDAMEERLSHSRYLLGPGHGLTESDIRLFVTIVRFDHVYYFHFKCNKRPISSYPNLTNWMRDIYQTQQLASTVNVPHIKTHYYSSHPRVNPYGIVPNGPDDISFDGPHDRATRTYE